MAEAERAVVVTITPKEGVKHNFATDFKLRPGTEDKIRLGRAPDSEILVEAKGTSNYHAELRLVQAEGKEPQLVIVDMSTNGTALKVPDGQPVRLKKAEDTPVPDGSLVVLPMKVKVVEGDAAASTRAQLVVSTMETAAAGKGRTSEECSKEASFAASLNAIASSAKTPAPPGASAKPEALSKGDNAPPAPGSNAKPEEPSSPTDLDVPGKSNAARPAFTTAAVAVAAVLAAARDLSKHHTNPDALSKATDTLAKTLRDAHASGLTKEKLTEVIKGPAGEQASKGHLAEGATSMTMRTPAGGAAKTQGGRIPVCPPPPAGRRIPICPGPGQAQSTQEGERRRSRSRSRSRNRRRSPSRRRRDDSRGRRRSRSRSRKRVNTPPRRESKPTPAGETAEAPSNTRISI